MKRTAPAHTITAIDIGTTKICVLVAHILPDGSMKILGIGQAPSEGLARGVIVSMAPAIHAVQMALREAELMAGFSIHEVWVGISGSHIHSYSSHGMVPLHHGHIRDEDIRNVLQAAQAIAIPEGQQLLHAVPQYFCINGNELVHNPHGMYGIRLEARVHIVTGAVSSVQNIIRCCELAGVRVQSIVLEPIASAEAVLTADEKELGVGMLDIGGGTSDFAVYQKQAICHTAIIPIAGNTFTQDIAICTRIGIQEAERIKKEYMPHSGNQSERAYLCALQADGIEQVMLEHAEIQNIIEARSEELCLLLRAHIEEHALRSHVRAGIVLTGGGSMLPAITKQASALLQLPVRVGKPYPDATNMALSHPLYATGYGLLLYAAKQRQELARTHDASSLVQRIKTTMKSWLFDIF